MHRASRADLTKSVMRIGLGTIALCGVFALAPLDLRDDTAGTRSLGDHAHRSAPRGHPAGQGRGHSSRPDLRAVEAIAVSSSLLVLPFASTSYAMDQAKSTSCDEPLTRTDAVYLAVTVFATVGFREVEATSQAARLVVTV